MLRTSLVVCGIPLCLCACGGGGSSSSDPNLQSVNAPSEPLMVAATTLTANSNGNGYSVTISSAPGSPVTFNGQTADTSILALTVSENGAVLATEDTTAYYLANPYSPLGIAGTTNGIAWTADITSFTPFPNTLTVGASGPVLSGDYRDSNGNIIGALTETYTVTADNSTALFLNINAAGSINGAPISETLTYSITAAEALTLAKAQVTINGTTLTFQ